MAYTLKDTERTAQAMIYLPGRLFWGELVHPMGIRPQGWLKMTMLPEFFLMLEANCLIFGNQKPVRLTYPEIYIPLAEVLAFHLLPPFEFIPDYDADEKNRVMKDVTINTDIFRFDGKVRISSLADFSFSIQGLGNGYQSLYDAEVSHPLTPNIRPIQVPYMLIRSNKITYLINHE